MSSSGHERPVAVHKDSPVVQVQVGPHPSTCSGRPRSALPDASSIHRSSAAVLGDVDVSRHRRDPPRAELASVQRVQSEIRGSWRPRRLDAAPAGDVAGFIRIDAELIGSTDDLVDAEAVCGRVARAGAVAAVALRAWRPAATGAPVPLKRIDCLSTVSGGGYLGGADVAFSRRKYPGATEPGAFPCAIRMPRSGRPNRCS